MVNLFSLLHYNPKVSNEAKQRSLTDNVQPLYKKIIDILQTHQEDTLLAFLAKESQTKKSPILKDQYGVAGIDLYDLDITSSEKDKSTFEGLNFNYASWSNCHFTNVFCSFYLDLASVSDCKFRNCSFNLFMCS